MKYIEEEIPFEVPDGWNWCRLRDVASIKGGKRVPKGFSLTDAVTGHAYIRVTDMKNNTIILDDIKYIDDNIYEIIKAYTISADDLYITVAGTIGAVGTVPPEMDGMNLTENAVKVTSIQINKNYLCYVIQSELVQGQFQDKTHHVAMPKLAIERILSTFIPVPPYKEQIKINNVIKDIVPNIEIIEKEKDILKDVVDITKAKVLDLAIQGKLVPQDSNDEPASILLERIRAEKEKLIKQGKLKRDKKESIIFKGDDNSYYEKKYTGEPIDITEEIPFDLPELWNWCRLKNIVQIINGDRGANYPAKSKLHDSGIPFVSASNIDNGFVSLSSGMKYLSDEQYNLLRAGMLQFNDIVYCIRGSLGKCGIFPYEKGAIASSLVIVRPYIPEVLLTDYIMLYLSSAFAFSEIKKYDNGTAQPNLAAKDFENFLIPLPPLNMIKRIVNKTNQLSYTLGIIQDAI